MEQMTRISAIRAFFEADGGRKVTMDEFKALSGDDRKELGEMAAEKLGVNLKD